MLQWNTENKINIEWIKPSRKHYLHLHSGKQVSSMSARLHVIHVGRMNTQVRLLNLLVRLAGRVNSEFARWLNA